MATPFTVPEDSDLIKQENSELRRSQAQLTNDLKDEKRLVRNLMATIKNYEKILRLEGQSCREETENILSNSHTRRNDSWGVLYSSLILIDEEYLELTTTVASMLEKGAKLERLHENRTKKICKLNMRIERLDAIVFGPEVDC